VIDIDIKLLNRESQNEIIADEKSGGKKRNKGRERQEE